MVQQNNKGLIVDALRAQGYRITSAREKIIGILCEGGHFTIDDIVKKMDQEQREANVATVYNNIRFLVYEGIVKEYQFASRAAYYELHTTVHAHFICEKCDIVKNIDIPGLLSLEHLVEEMGFNVKHSRLDVYGECITCQKEGKDKK